MKKIVLLIVAIFFLNKAVAPSYAATVTFTGVGTTLNWLTGANWSTGGTPTPADDVVINNNSSINLNIGVSISSLTLGNAVGNSTPTLIFNYNAGSIGPLTITNNLTVGPSATITHTASSNGTVYGTVNINVVSGSADIKGFINTDSRGYTSASGPGSPGSATWAGGAGHGGVGGGGKYGNVGGVMYDSIKQPTQMGSAGAEFVGSSGKGGGIIKLNIGGTLTITSPGSISAQGGPASGGGGPGGGSGGSIYIATGTLSGNGIIDAIGGSADNNGGGGSGGIIAIYYTVDNATITYRTYGGAGYAIGSSGSLYKKDTTAATDSLTIDNNNQNYPLANNLPASVIINTGSTFTSIILKNKGNLEIGPSANITYTSLDWGTSGYLTDNGGTMAQFSSGGGLTVPTSAVYIVNVGRTFSNITLNGQISHSPNYSTEKYKINVTVTGNLILGSSGSINASAKGFANNTGTGTATSTGPTNAGGSYGGSGGTSGTGRNSGPAYGSLMVPVNIGSGGGANGSNFTNTGAGAIKLTIGGTLSFTSPSYISAIGGSDSSGGTGGGSGGSIYIIAPTISGTGTINANGGIGMAGNSAGGGGGGRIAIYYQDLSPSVTISNIGGTGNNGGSSGAVGTIFKKATSSSLISTPFDTGDPGTLLYKLTWGETLPANTTVKVQLRTAPDSNGSPGTWSSWLGPTSSSDYYTDPAGATPINTTQTDGSSDQWFQYQIFMTSAVGDSNVPIVNNVSIQYIVNTPPTISITNLPTQSSDGTIAIGYTASDPEESHLSNYLLADIGVTTTSSLTSGSTAPITVSDASHFPNSGTILIGIEAITYTQKTGNVLGGTITRAVLNTRPANHSSGAFVWINCPSATNIGTSIVNGSHNAVWTARNDILNLEKSGVNLLLMANDGNLANQATTTPSTTINIDTKAPSNGDIFINARTGTLTLAAGDTNAIFMKISTNSDLSADGLNGTSGQWQNLGTSFPWTLASSTAPVYVSYKDSYNNSTSTYSSVAPPQPSNLIIQDASNPLTNEWRLFLSWGIADTTPIPFAYYQIYSSNTNSNFQPLTQITDRNQNYYLNSGLDKTKTYYYKVTVIDTHGDESAYNSNNIISGSSSKSNVGLTPDGSGGGDYTAPVISNIAYSSLTTTSATITWTTDEISDSKVGYSTDTSYQNEVGTITVGTSHSISLTGLLSNTKYYFRVISYDAVSNKAIKEDSSLQYFTTPTDTNAPIISDIKSVTGDASAGITWATNKAANSKVDYGSDTNYGTSVSALDLVFGHSIAIPSLSPGTTYHFKITSIDSNGNTSVSPDNNFTTTGSLPTLTPTAAPTSIPTPGDTTITPTIAPTFTPTPTPTPGPDLTPPSISNISVSNLSSVSTTISWSTDELADGRVEYGESSSYERGIAEGNHDFTTSKSINLIGLSPETTYHYRIIAVDKSGNINTSADTTFSTISQSILTTLSDTASSSSNAPVISSDGPSVSDITGTSAIIKWTTSKRSTSLVFFKIKNSLETPASSGDATTFIITHTATLTNLSPATTYDYQVKSVDVNGNYSLSSKSEFTTTLPNVVGVRVTNVSENAAQISWTTQIPTTSNLEYTNSVTQETQKYADKSLVTAHTVALSNLYAAATYSFSVLINDQSGNSARSESYSFTTKNDKNGPIITNVNNRSAISSQDKVQTVISWTTGEPSTSKVEYSLGGGNGNYEFSSTENADYVTNHIIVVSNLKPATVYRFRTNSKDRSGNSAYSDAYVLLTPQRQVTALDLILQNLEGAFGWAKRIGG